MCIRLYGKLRYTLHLDNLYIAMWNVSCSIYIFTFTISLNCIAGWSISATTDAREREGTSSCLLACFSNGKYITEANEPPFIFDGMFLCNERSLTLVKWTLTLYPCTYIFIPITVYSWHRCRCSASPSIRCCCRDCARQHPPASSPGTTAGLPRRNWRGACTTWTALVLRDLLVMQIIVIGAGHCYWCSLILNLCSLLQFELLYLTAFVNDR